MKTSIHQILELNEFSKDKESEFPLYGGDPSTWMNLRSFMFESFLHCIEAWYYAFKKRCDDVDNGDLPGQYMSSGYEVQLSPLPIDDMCIRFVRDSEESEIHIFVMFFGIQKHYDNPADAAERMVVGLGESILRFFEGWPGMVKAMKGGDDAPRQEFIVTEKPCGEMWNATTKCVRRTEGDICVFCNKKIGD